MVPWRRRGTVHALKWRESREDAEPFYVVEVRGAGVLVTRTRRRYESVDEVEPSFRAVDDALDDAGPGIERLLVDLRKIVGRNDAEFEAALAPYRRRLLSRFRATGIVVRSTIGRMQLERYLAADGLTATVFEDEEAAMTWLDGGD